VRKTLNFGESIIIITYLSYSVLRYIVLLLLQRPVTFDNVSVWRKSAPSQLCITLWWGAYCYIFGRV